MRRSKRCSPCRVIVRASVSPSSPGTPRASLHSTVSANLLHEARPSLKEDIAQLRLVARLLGTGKGRGEVEHALDHLPRKLERLARTASYGSWFNYYVCSVKFRLDSGTPVDPQVRELLNRITLNDSAKRCDP